MALSPRGDTVVSVSSPDDTSSMICLWDSASVKQLWCGADDHTIYDAVFSPDGHVVYLADADGTVRVLGI